MRTFLTILISLAVLSASAQSPLPVGAPVNAPVGAPAATLRPVNTPYLGGAPLPTRDSGSFNHQLQLRPYASISTGYIFLNRGISYLSAPVGLALVYPINRNISAFAGASASPVVFSVNQLNSYPDNNFAKPRSYNFGWNARVEGGLMYTNDAKTFSISGSVGVERGSSPAYPAYRTNTKRQ
jgi:hypothetical protein